MHCEKVQCPRLACAQPVRANPTDCCKRCPGEGVGTEASWADRRITALSWVRGHTVRVDGRDLSANAAFTGCYSVPSLEPGFQTKWKDVHVLMSSDGFQLLPHPSVPLSVHPPTHPSIRPNLSSTKYKKCLGAGDSKTKKTWVALAEHISAHLFLLPSLSPFQQWQLGPTLSWGTPCRPMGPGAAVLQGSGFQRARAGTPQCPPSGR